MLPLLSVLSAVVFVHSLHGFEKTTLLTHLFVQWLHF